LGKIIEITKALKLTSKLATEQLAAKDKEHVLSMNEKNNEIDVRITIIFFNLMKFLKNLFIEKKREKIRHV
jgi:hypothetical protein